MLQPSIPSLVARFMIASTLVLGGAYELRHALIEPLIPVFRGIILFVDPEFTLEYIGVAQKGTSEVLDIRANLSAPVEYGGRTILPFGWNDGPRGFF